MKGGVNGSRVFRGRVPGVRVPQIIEDLSHFSLSRIMNHLSCSGLDGDLGNYREAGGRGIGSYFAAGEQQGHGHDRK